MGSRVLTRQPNSSFFLAQPQQSQRADQRGLDVAALRFGFFNLRDKVGGVDRKFGIGMPFGHDVVVVGVEPFLSSEGHEHPLFLLGNHVPKQSSAQGQTSPSFERMQVPR